MAKVKKVAHIASVCKRDDGSRIWMIEFENVNTYEDAKLGACAVVAKRLEMEQTEDWFTPVATILTPCGDMQFIVASAATEALLKSAFDFVRNETKHLAPTVN